VPDLAALLDKEASAEVEAVLSEARERASEIVAAAKDEGDTLLAQRRRQAESQRAATVVRARSSAQLEAASVKLRAQHEGVETVFAAAREEIDAVVKDAKRYAPVFKALLQEAAAGVPADRIAAVIVHPREKRVAEAAVKELGIAAPVEAREDVRTGVRLRVGTNNLIENSLLERLDALRSELASEVSAALFGDSAKG